MDKMAFFTGLQKKSPTFLLKKNKHKLTYKTTFLAWPPLKP